MAAAAGPTIPCAVTAASPDADALGLGALAPLAAPVLVAFTTYEEGPSALRAPELTPARMLRFGRAAALPAVSIDGS